MEELRKQIAIMDTQISVVNECLNIETSDFSKSVEWYNSKLEELYDELTESKINELKEEMINKLNNYAQKTI